MTDQRGSIEPSRGYAARSRPADAGDPDLAAPLEVPQGEERRGQWVECADCNKGAQVITGAELRRFEYEHQRVTGHGSFNVGPYQPPPVPPSGVEGERAMTLDEWITEYGNAVAWQVDEGADDDQVERGVARATSARNAIRAHVSAMNANPLPSPVSEVEEARKDLDCVLDLFRLDLDASDREGDLVRAVDAFERAIRRSVVAEVREALDEIAVEVRGMGEALHTRRGHRPSFVTCHDELCEAERAIPARLRALAQVEWKDGTK